MKFLLRSDESKIERYIKKLSKGKNIPLITSNDNLNLGNNIHDKVQYTIDFNNTKIKIPNDSWSMFESDFYTPIIENNRVTYHLDKQDVKSFHKVVLTLLEQEIPQLQGKFNEENWEYWKMIKNYHEFRKNFNYYKTAVDFALILHDRKQGRVLDVGIKDSTTTLDMFPNTYEKFAIDNEFPQDFVPPKNINCIEIDLFEYNPKEIYDIVLCQQVLEHVKDPKKFYSKLESLSRNIVIISVPYGSWHKTPFDPINEDRVKEWTGKTPLLEKIVKDFGVERYVAAYSIR